MKTVACPSCSSVNTDATVNAACVQCGTPLAPALFQQSVDELKELTSKMQQMNAPRPSFNSFNGFGTTLLDYRQLPDGTYQATRWIIALFLPVAPLAAYIIQPEAQERKYGQETSKFTILDKTPLSPIRVLRTYMLAIAGLAPIILGFVYQREVNHALRGTYAFGLMILCFVWAMYIIFFKLKNEGKAYSAKTTS